MTREQVIQGYLMNSPEVVAEMLYDTIERYESRSCESCKNFEEENDKCHRGVMLNWRHEIDDIDFYCNKWELR